MNAQKALEVSKSNPYLFNDKKYNSIISRIERSAKDGKTEIAFGFVLPCDEIIEKLEEQGFWIYSIGDNFICPKMYGVSWKNQEAKKSGVINFLRKSFSHF